MSYAIFFNVEDTTIRIPVNPQELSISEDQNMEEYDILKLGKIVIPASMGLKKYSFEAEFPSRPYPYVVTKNGFKNASFYIELFRKWREEKRAIRFIACNGIKNISELVVFESMDLTEKPGEEGDYYISFDLKEYRPFQIKINEDVVVRPANPPKIDNLYTIRKGDTLWSIAKRFLGDGGRYKEIHQLNIPPLGNNPNLIYPGQKIKIPEVGGHYGTSN